MQLKDVLVALAVPALCTAAAIPQDSVPEFPEGEFPENPIVGGATASQGDFPYIVSIQRSGSHFCGGSLLNANTVLTAAHCAVGQTASQLQIRAGSLSRTSGGTLVRVSSIRVNPSYAAGTYNNDVAILKLSTSVPTSSTISYARLPASGSDPAAGLGLSVAGWGTTSSGGQSLPVNLLKVDVPVISRATCNSNYGSGSVTTAMFCAGLTQGGKDSCQGDSGGPIVNAASRVQLGIVSWGEGCAAAGAPGVYTNLGQSGIASFVASNL
ncbi:trypsin-like cysteine/serine peptidase domain-containing protein [Ampelomyces quisqualis]|uniref:Trypsin-like cysteine/serine peptidase domain-containing protein n=1 Tax=Ampelomyces quisqualis TaxID=50730 RepID=A0A6A5QQ43_AMPQU|nr:trypsin-like cysteine/serine peptidase domain-containing protein [Ampelomyces quisqualis]